MKTMIVIQDSQPGLLAEVTALLAESGMSLEDVSAQSFGRAAVISLQVQPYDESFRLLSQAGYHVYASDTLLIRLQQEPGVLARVSRQLADAGVNVRGLHFVNRDKGVGIVALETDQQDRAREVLNDLLV